VGRLCFLSSLDETTTKLHLHAEKLTETVLHLNLGHFVVVFFVFVFVFPFDEKDRTTSETPSPALEAK
jgi:hypothetical protein